MDFDELLREVDTTPEDSDTAVARKAIELGSGLDSWASMLEVPVTRYVTAWRAARRKSAAADAQAKRQQLVDEARARSRREAEEAAEEAAAEAQRIAAEAEQAEAQRIAAEAEQTAGEKTVPRPRAGTAAPPPPAPPAEPEPDLLTDAERQRLARPGPHPAPRRRTSSRKPAGQGRDRQRGHPLAHLLPPEKTLFVNMRIGDVPYSKVTVDHLRANILYHMERISGWNAKTAAAQRAIAVNEAILARFPDASPGDLVIDLGVDLNTELKETVQEGVQA